jgi:hypothetical protein
MPPTVSIVNLCLGPALPLLPFLVILAWARCATVDRLAARVGVRSGRATRVLIAFIALIITGLAVLRLSQGRFTSTPDAVGPVQALYIVTSYPVWFVIGFVGFVNLMALPSLLQGRRSPSEALGAVALALWLFMVAAFLIADPTTIVNSYASFIRYAPLNLSVGVAFAVASAFMYRPALKDRQITLVTLLMIGLFVGMIGMIALSSQV